MLRLQSLYAGINLELKAKMRRLPDIRNCSRMGSYFILFIVAQVTVGILISLSVYRSGKFDGDPIWLSKALDSSLMSSGTRSGGFQADTARQQLKFVRQVRSWMSMVYHDETTSALKPPQELLNASIPLEKFCKHKRNSSTIVPRYAVFRNVMLVGRQLLLPSSIDCDSVSAKGLSISTVYHLGQKSTPKLQAMVVPNTESFEDFESIYSCHERVYEPSVLFSFLNWPQHGHALFNAISLLWEAFQDSETGPLFEAGKNVRLYAFGDDLRQDKRQEWQQYFPFYELEGLDPLMTMFSHQPVRTLASLLMQSDRHPICFTYLLAGIPGELDHYNFWVPPTKWRDFSRAVREHFGVPGTPRLSYGEPLQRLAPRENKWLPNNNVSMLGEIRPVDWEAVQHRPRLVIIDRRDNRKLVNVQLLLQIAKSTSYFKSVQVAYLEDMELGKQIQLIGETDVLFGMDGTGLMNGLFMPEGGVVVHVRPYGCAEYLQGKGMNFIRLWSANPGRVILFESGDRNTTIFPANLPEREELVFNPNSTVAYRFPFILRQDTLVDPDAFRCILNSCHKLLHGVSVDWDEHNQCTQSVFV